MARRSYDYEYIKVEYEKKSIDSLLEEVGLTDNGSIQTFHTANVLRRIQRYMPFVSGSLIKLTILQTDINEPVIITRAPQAHYLWNGKVWVDPITKAAGFLTEDGWKSRRGVSKIPTERNLVFNQEKNPQAGAQWAERLKAYEMPVMTRELQSFIKRSARRNP